MTKWTPGPWQFTNQGADKRGFYTHQIGTHEQTVAYTFEPGLKREEQHANAHLIAAAPELYNALEDIVKGFDDGRVTVEATNLARAALAKARNEK